jgi:hypothetical protein
MKTLLPLTLLLLAITPGSARAGEGEASPQICTLKNQVFCGEWEDNQTFKTTILGHRLLSSTNVPVEECIIVDEFVDQQYPYSILKCTYFNPVINREQTDYELYYMSEGTAKENTRVEGFQNIFNVTASKLRELFLAPEWDRDKNGRPIPTRDGRFLYRKVKE